MPKRAGKRAPRGRAAKGKGTPSRATRPRKGGKSVLGDRVRAVRKGVKAVGRGRIKPGPIELGSTRRLTPTRAGFRALDDALLAIQRHDRGGRSETAELYTFDLDIRWRGPDGRFVKGPPLNGNTIPNLREVRRRRKKGETLAAAFRRVVETDIKRAIFRQVDNAKDLKGGTDELLRRMRGKSEKQVRAALRQFKARRSLTFKVRLNRVHY